MNLKVIREQRGLSVPRLSILSGVTVYTIHNIERTDDGKVSAAIKLADALGVTLDELCRTEFTEGTE